MEKFKVKIKSKDYFAYNVIYEDKSYTIGSEELGDVIDECIENDQYYYPMVELETGEIIKVSSLDEIITFFVCDMPNPTEQDLINELTNCLLLWEM